MYYGKPKDFNEKILILFLNFLTMNYFFVNFENLNVNTIVYKFLLTIINIFSEVLTDKKPSDS